ncbi:MAG: cbb3-type cytochrome oxidase assembly protein CcoS [Flavobacteriales bacterium]|nr:cbb3-type cytochrome oxidase assembly protein CcoS [Flavobacteriales bacterium]
MSAIYILIGASLPIAIGFLIAFLISAKRGQFDDDYTPSIRMLTDDTETENQTNQTAEEPKRINV